MLTAHSAVVGNDLLDRCLPTPTGPFLLSNRLGRAVAMAPPPDGDERARLQDLDEADAQGQEQ